MASRTTGSIRKAKAAAAEAPLLPFPGSRRGGRRPGAGRKPNGAEAGMPHDARPALAARHPVHVTVKLSRGLPRLRQKVEYAVLRSAFAAANARGAAAGDGGAFRLCQYVAIDNHLHLLVEAGDRPALARGMQGLLVRIARRLNKLWQRRGSVFADRYHERVLKTPRDVRHVLRYIFGNARKHAAAGGVPPPAAAIDVYSSAPWFDGFRERVVVRNLPAERPTAEARTWLLRVGWRQHGLLSVYEVPATG